MGRVSRDVDAWNTRVALAETLNARVLTDLKVGAAFPTDHPLHAAPPGVFLTPDAAGGGARSRRDPEPRLGRSGGHAQAGLGATTTSPSRVIQVSMDQVLHNGISMDHQGLPPTDLVLFCDPESAVDDLAREIGVHAPTVRRLSARASKTPASLRNAARSASAWWPTRCEHALDGGDACLLHLPLGWAGDMWHFRHPLDFVGSDGGGGIGAGPGLTVGGAIALKGTARLPVSILGDGDYLMGVTAFWTAANARVPLLAIVCNNRSFFNDEVHQERVAKDARPPGREPLDRPAHRRSGARPRDDRARAGPRRHRSGHRCRSTCRRRCATRCDAVAQGKAVVVDVHVSPATTRRWPRASRARTARRVFLETSCRNLRRNGDSIRPDNVLPSHFDLYYGGQWHAPRGGEYVDDDQSRQWIRSIAKVAHASAEDAGAAIVAAHKAFRAWARCGAARARRACCKDAAQVLRDEAEALAMLDALNTGNPCRRWWPTRRSPRQAIEYFAGLVTEVKGETIPMGRRCSTTRCASRWAWWRGSSRTTIRSCSRP